jgi:hypothetical protein
MTARVGPWSVKGISPEARQVAKQAAQRAGMTLGEWINRLVLQPPSPALNADPVNNPDPPANTAYLAQLQQLIHELEARLGGLQAEIHENLRDFQQKLDLLEAAAPHAAPLVRE